MNMAVSPPTTSPPQVRKTRGASKRLSKNEIRAAIEASVKFGANVKLCPDGSILASPIVVTHIEGVESPSPYRGKTGVPEKW